jgi:hypothetical protein
MFGEKKELREEALCQYQETQGKRNLITNIKTDTNFINNGIALHLKHSFGFFSKLIHKSLYFIDNGNYLHNYFSVC